MLEIRKINKVEDFKNITREEFIDFLFTHLGKFEKHRKRCRYSTSWRFV